MRYRRRAIAALAGAAGLLLATACGSSGGGTASGSTSSIPVGVIGSYSGPATSSIAGAKEAIQAWADSVNAAGGINGHPVSLFIKDDGGNVSTSVSEAKELVQQDH